MEIRENNVELKAMGLVQEFIKKFRSLDFTVHPANIPGESAGKGSNMAWAVRQLSERYSMDIRRDVIITGIDGMFSAAYYYVSQHNVSASSAYFRHALTFGACS